MTRGFVVGECVVIVGRSAWMVELDPVRVGEETLGEGCADLLRSRVETGMSSVVGIGSVYVVRTAARELMYRSRSGDAVEGVSVGICSTSTDCSVRDVGGTVARGVMVSRSSSSRCQVLKGVRKSSGELLEDECALW